MNIIVGSTALQKFGLNRSLPVDIDYWTDQAETDLTGDVKIIPNEVLRLVDSLGGVATPDSIYTIKCSHAVYDIFWQKTKLDILWLKSKGCKILPNLYQALVEYWKEEHGNKDFLSLAQNKTEFFTGNVTYVYDHDYLHELVAYPNRPVYESVLKDNQEVLIDKDKFFKLPFPQQVRMFREEIAVIACERFLINPHVRGKVSWFQAYTMALRKTVTTLTKGWASEFIVMNLEHFHKPDYSYFEYLIETIEGIKFMSKNVDMKVFKELQEELNGVNMDDIIYALCESDIWILGDQLEGDYPKRKDKVNFILEKYGYKHLEQEGGGEGGTEYCYGVFELNGKIYKAKYSYYSYDGHEYDGIENTLKEVKPVEKVVTVYE